MSDDHFNEQTCTHFVVPEDLSDEAPAVLLAIGGPLIGSTFRLDERVVGIGRREAVICIPSQAVSKLHCAIERRGERTFVIRDEESTNGTYVNGRRIEPGVELALANGDTIGICESRFLFQLAGRVAQPRAEDLAVDVGAARAEAVRLLAAFPELEGVRRARRRS